MERERDQFCAHCTISASPSVPTAALVARRFSRPVPSPWALGLPCGACQEPGHSRCAVDRRSWDHTCLSSHSLRCQGSAEGERKSLHACIEKLDLELAISNVPRLSDQLIQPLVGHRAVALLVNVTS